MKASFFSLFLTVLCVSMHAQLVVEELPNLNYARVAHQQIAVGQDKFVVVGGHVNGFNLTTSSEIYNSVTKTWQLVSSKSSHDAGFIAKLNNGKYLIGGGCSSGLGVGQQSATEIFDPTDNSFTAAANMKVARTSACAATLKDGRVIVVGNWYASASNAEIYDPATNTFTLTGTCLVQRTVPIIIPTNDGGAIIGGTSTNYGATTSSFIFEKYNPTTNSFTELTRTLFDGVTSWSVGANTNGFMSNQLLMPNGKYAVLVYTNNNTKARLLSIDPETDKLEEIITKSPITLSDETTSYGSNNFLLIDKNRNLLHIVQQGGTTSNIILRIVTVNLKTGEVNSAKKDGFDFSLVSSSLSLLPDGRILFTGGNKFDNFNMSNRAFIVTVPNYTWQTTCDIPFYSHKYFDKTSTSGYVSFKEMPSGGYTGVAYHNSSDLRNIKVSHFDHDGKNDWVKNVLSFKVTPDKGLAVIDADVASDGNIYVLTAKYESSQWKNYVLKVTASGDSVWNVYIAPEQTLSKIKCTPDGGCVVSGRTPYWAPSPKVMKINKNGTIQWTNTNFTSDLGYNIFNDVAVNSNGEIFVTGTVHNNPSNRNSFLLAKLDSTGTSKWEKVYYSGYFNSGDSIYGWGNSISYTDDGGCIIGGFVSDKGRNDGKGGAFLRKVDANGNTVWEKKYFRNGYYPYFASVHKLSEPNKFIAYGIQQRGSTVPEATVLKFTDTGDSLWIQQGYDYRVSLSDVDNNDNLLFVASSPHSETSETIWENQALLYRTSSDGIYQTPQFWVDPENNATKVKLQPDFSWSTTSHIGNYRLQVSTDSTFNSIDFEDNDIPATNYQFTYHTLSKQLKPITKYFTRVQQVGPQGCTSAWSDIRRFTTLDNTAVKNNSMDIFKIYPNPATSVLTIEFSQIPDMNSTIEIMDITGKTVYSDKIQNFNNLNGNKLYINLAELSDGFYSCKLTNEKTNTVKMLVVKK